MPDAVASAAAGEQIHPALLDACLQGLIPAFPAGTDCYLPVGLDAVRVLAPGRLRPGAGLWAHGILRDVGRADKDTERIGGDLFVLAEDGQVVLEAVGLTLQRLGPASHARVAATGPADWLYQVKWQRGVPSSPAQNPEPLQVPQRQPRSSGRWLIFTDNVVGPKLESLLEACGEDCVLVSPGDIYRQGATGQYDVNPACVDDFRQLLADAFGADRPPCRGIVHLWSLRAVASEEATAASLQAAQSLACVTVLHLVHALRPSQATAWPRLWLVTSGVHVIDVDAEGACSHSAVSVAQSPLWGLGSALAHEHPELRNRRVNLGPDPGQPQEIESLFQEMRCDNLEDQVALRGPLRYVARLVPSTPRAAPADDGEIARRQAILRSDRPFRLTIASPGMLDGLSVQVCPRQSPAPGDVEVEVSAVGLNFRDVLSALAILPGYAGGVGPLGIECAGRISALEPASPIFRSDRRSSRSRLPASVALHWLLRRQSCPSQLRSLSRRPRRCRWRSSRPTTPSATWAGSQPESGSSCIQRQGASVTQPFNWRSARAPRSLRRRARTTSANTCGRLASSTSWTPRSTAFGDQVMAITGGSGVDVVLNSLSGEAAHTSLAVLRPYGRFLELGKRGVYQNGHLALPARHENLSFFAIDVFRLLQDRPALAGSLLREVLRESRRGNHHPAAVSRLSHHGGRERLPGHGTREAHRQDRRVDASAWRLTPGRTCGGRIGARCRPGNSHAGRHVPDHRRLGGLGVAVARWLVDRGARYLVLMGRNGAIPPVAAMLDGIRDAGAHLVIAKGDVAHRDQVADILADIDRSLPPLKGIFHAAGVLDDGILLQMNRGALRGGDGSEGQRGVESAQSNS